MRLFGKKEEKPTPKELSRQVKRDITKEKRTLDRDIQNLDREEKKIVLDIKAAAKRGEKKNMEQLAKQIIQLRKTRERLQTAQSRLGGMQAQATNMAATAAMGETIKNTTGIMGKMNEQMDPKEMQQIMKQFAQENAKAEAKDELVADMFDMMDPDDMEEEMDAEVGKVMDELAVDAFMNMPASQVAPSVSAATAPEDAELAARLAQLNLS